MAPTATSAPDGICNTARGWQPQATRRADRESAYAQWDLALGQALQQEWLRGKARIPDALEGATRFAHGEGRHGRF